MPNIARGNIPIPSDDDMLANGAKAIRDAATALSNMLARLPWAMAAGAVPSGGAGSVTITLPVGRFQVTPVVTAIADAATGDAWTQVRTRSQTSFTVVMYNAAAGGGAAGVQGPRAPTGVAWIAVQMGETTAYG